MPIAKNKKQYYLFDNGYLESFRAIFVDSPSVIIKEPAPSSRYFGRFLVRINGSHRYYKLALIEQALAILEQNLDNADLLMALKSYLIALESHIKDYGIPSKYYLYLPLIYLSEMDQLLSVCLALFFAFMSVFIPVALCIFLAPILVPKMITIIAIVVSYLGISGVIYNLSLAFEDNAFSILSRFKKWGDDLTERFLDFEKIQVFKQNLSNVIICSREVGATAPLAIGAAGVSDPHVMVGRSARGSDSMCTRCILFSRREALDVSAQAGTSHHYNNPPFNPSFSYSR